MHCPMSQLRFIPCGRLGVLSAGVRGEMRAFPGLLALAPLLPSVGVCGGVDGGSKPTRWW